MMTAIAAAALMGGAAAFADDSCLDGPSKLEGVAANKAIVAMLKNASMFDMTFGKPTTVKEVVQAVIGHVRVSAAMPWGAHALQYYIKDSCVDNQLETTLSVGVSTAYDVLVLVCESAGCSFSVKDGFLVIEPRTVTESNVELRVTVVSASLSDLKGAGWFLPKRPAAGDLLAKLMEKESVKIIAAPSIMAKDGHPVSL